MNCRTAGKYIILMADDELDDALKKDMLMHLNNCAKCKGEYDRIISMKQILKSDPYIVSLKNDILGSYMENDKRPVFRKETYKMKKRYAAIALLSIFIIGIFIPVEGKSVAKSIGVWAKSISFTMKDSNSSTEPETEINISASLDLDEYYKAVEEDKKKPILDSTKDKEYSSIDEAKEKGCTNFTPPRYLASGLKLNKIFEFKGSQDIPTVIKLLYEPDGSGQNNVLGCNDVKYRSLCIIYALDTYPSNTIFREDAVLMKAKVLNYEGYFIKTKEEKAGIYFIGLNIPMHDSHLALGSTIPLDKCTDDVIEKVQNELGKIAESILSQ